VTGFILAAGLGTRLSPITSHIPKALVPVCGIPLFEHACSYLDSNGVFRIGANAHYMADKIMAFAQGFDCSPEIFFESEKILGTGGALYFARQFLKNDDFFCVLNADIITNANLARIIENFTSSDSIAVLVASSAADKGSVLLNPVDCRYVGTSGENLCRNGLVPADFIGIALYRKEFLDLLTPDDFSITPVWRRAVDAGCNISVSIQPDIYWNDLGTPQKLAQIHFDAIDGSIAVNVAKNIKIDSALKKAYPADISQNSIESLGRYVWCNTSNIGKASKVEKSILFKDVKIADSAQIKNSIITLWEEISLGENI
jgi:NDP-sugar pyrophosphorylase family protein